MSSMENFKVYGIRYAIIRKPLVCWMAASGNLEVLSNSDEAVRYLPLGEVYLGFKPAGVFRACGRDQGAFEESPLDPKPF